MKRTVGRILAREPFLAIVDQAGESMKVVGNTSQFLQKYLPMQQNGALTCGVSCRSSAMDMVGVGGAHGRLDRSTSAIERPLPEPARFLVQQLAARAPASGPAGR